MINLTMLRSSHGRRCIEVNKLGKSIMRAMAMTGVNSVARSNPAAAAEMMQYIMEDEK